MSLAGSRTRTSWLHAPPLDLPADRGVQDAVTHRSLVTSTPSSLSTSTDTSMDDGEVGPGVSGVSGARPVVSPFTAPFTAVLTRLTPAVASWIMGSPGASISRSSSLSCALIRMSFLRPKATASTYRNKSRVSPGSSAADPSHHRAGVALAGENARMSGTPRGIPTFGASGVTSTANLHLMGL